MSGFATGRVAKAICDRCKMKVPYLSLRSDPNSPGMRVCRDGCWDKYDPWRLPALIPEPITMMHPRPEEALDPPPSTLNVAEENWDIPISTTDGEVILV